jgi:hypothetical protein
MRVLIETNYDAELTLNLFVTEEISPKASKNKVFKQRFHSCETIQAIGGNPKATTLRNLSPNTKYCLFIGGIKAKETLELKSNFFTLPISTLANNSNRTHLEAVHVHNEPENNEINQQNDEKIEQKLSTKKNENIGGNRGKNGTDRNNSRECRILVAHDGRIDRIYTGEVDLWQNIENKICYQFAKNTTEIQNNSFSAISNGNSGDDGVVDSSEDGGPVHIFLHCGNLLSVDSGGGGGIKMKAMEAFESLIREDSGRDSWVGNWRKSSKLFIKCIGKYFRIVD